jgi:hypothetical protein
MRHIWPVRQQNPDQPCDLNDRVNRSAAETQKRSLAGDGAPSDGGVEYAQF